MIKLLFYKVREKEMDKEKLRQIYMEYIEEQKREQIEREKQREKERQEYIKQRDERRAIAYEKKKKANRERYWLKKEQKLLEEISKIKV